MVRTELHGAPMGLPVRLGIAAVVEDQPRPLYASARVESSAIARREAAMAECSQLQSPSCRWRRQEGHAQSSMGIGIVGFQFERLPQECEPGIVVTQVEADQKLPSPQDVVVGRRIAGASSRQARSLSRRELNLQGRRGIRCAMSLCTPKMSSSWRS